MPAYSFQKQFVPFVESGEKTHTIRGKRKNRPKPGQTFYGYYAMRTKQCRKLIQSTITRVQDIEIILGPFGMEITIDDERLSPDEIVALARRDGFDSASSMEKFWNGRYPFSGDLIHWSFDRRQR
jgi:hypothetical protein